MRKLLSGFLLVHLLLFAVLSFAQDNKKKKAVQQDSAALLLESQLQPTTALDPKAEEAAKKEAAEAAEEQAVLKKKKSDFYGIKFKKAATKEVAAGKVVVEKFSIAKVYTQPSRFVDFVYYFDFNDKKIKRSSVPIKPEDGMPMHGAYTKYVNGQIVEQGFYYLGTKHGRWEKYGKDLQLISKEKYFKGFPKESAISYHDPEQTKIKEVTPIQNGDTTGFYLEYYESGNIKTRGEYVEGWRVGKWYDYYDNNKVRNMKRETQYPRKPYDQTSPAVLREWDETGKLTVNNTKSK